MVRYSSRLQQKQTVKFEKIKRRLQVMVINIKHSSDKSEKIKNIHIFFDILKDNLDYLQNDTQLNIISLYKLHEYESAGFNKNKYIKAFKCKNDNKNVKECAICLEEFDNMPESDKPRYKFTLDCNHSFCLNCLYNTILCKCECPLCREYINQYL